MISGCGVAARLDPVGGGLEDRPGLHGEQAGDDDARAARRAGPASGSARAAAARPRAAAAGACRACRATSASGHLDRQLGEVGQELVQRRVDQPDRDRQPVHRLEDLDEVVALQRQQRGERGLLRRPRPRPGSGCSTSSRRSPRNMCSVRHRPMPCGAEPAGAGGVLGGVGVGAHPQPADARRRAP